MSEPQDFVLPPQLLDAARKVIEANRRRGKRIALPAPGVRKLKANPSS